jgi:hypothetical protein
MLHTAVRKSLGACSDYHVTMVVESRLGTLPNTYLIICSATTIVDRTRNITDTLWTECSLISQETRYVSATEPNQIMLFGETVAVYCENRMEHTDTLCGQNVGF